MQNIVGVTIWDWSSITSAMEFINGRAMLVSGCHTFIHLHWFRSRPAALISRPQDFRSDFGIAKGILDLFGEVQNIIQNTTGFLIWFWQVILTPALDLVLGEKCLAMT